MGLAFEVRETVLKQLDRFGVEIYIQGHEAVQFEHIPLPSGYSHTETDLRFCRDGNCFLALVPKNLTYSGSNTSQHEALAGPTSGRWRALQLDRSECHSFEATLAAALVALDSPARVALRRGAASVEQSEADSARSALDQFATLLTPAIERGCWPEIVERDEELEFIEDALVHHSPGPRIVLVCGAVGVGRWSTGAVGLGQRMICRTARAELSGRQLYLLNPASIVGGLMMIGELEDRILQIASEAAAGGHVLFIPDKGLDVLRLLPPLHDLNVVARVTPMELKAWELAAPNQVGKATVVPIHALSTHSTESVLAAHQPLLLEHYKLARLERPVIQQAAALAGEFLAGALPGTAVQLLEQACAVASRATQRAGDGVVREDHLLTALKRLGGEQAADDVLGRWFRRATARMRRQRGKPESYEPSAADNETVEEED